ncbi:MAG: hypothetical protein M3464_18025 [Chloroflexota bacterium]|nr:hypothetical protein [Chloroflexota bacterium]
MVRSDHDPAATMAVPGPRHSSMAAPLTPRWPVVLRDSTTVEGDAASGLGCQ